MKIPTANPGDNAILRTLPSAERDRLVKAMTKVSMVRRQVLFDEDETTPAIYFPTAGTVSLITVLANGNVIEAATVGTEGIVGIPHVPGGRAGLRAVCQVRGSAFRMAGGAFHNELSNCEAFREVVERYAHALFGQIAQVAACNRLHSNPEQLSRWLLMRHDRIGGDAFEVTHGLLAQMLGCRRPTITLSAGTLQDAGSITYHRGHVTIEDRRALEANACECYFVIENALTSAVGPRRRSSTFAE